ncbi:MAG: hypothetical protein U1D55_04815 [Phycisphaerae bacterium]
MYQHVRFWSRAACFAGLLVANGCFAVAQQNLDLLLGSGAIDNAARLPYSAIWPIAELFLRVFRG